MQAWPGCQHQGYQLFPPHWGLFVINDSLLLNISLTYLTFSFIGCTVVEKLCHQTFQCPERGFFRCLTKKFEKNNKKISNCIFNSTVPQFLQVTFNSHSNLLPQNILVQHSSNTWYKPENCKEFPRWLKTQSFSILYKFVLPCYQFSIIYAKEKRANNLKFNSGNILKAN